MVDFGLSKIVLKEVWGSYAVGAGISYLILGMSNKLSFFADENLTTPLGFFIVETSFIYVSTLLKLNSNA